MKQAPIGSFDVVQWDDGTFTLSWRSFLSQAGFGNSYVRYRSIQELAEMMHKIAEECSDRQTASHSEEAT